MFIEKLTDAQLLDLHKKLVCPASEFVSKTINDDDDTYPHSLSITFLEFGWSFDDGEEDTGLETEYRYTDFDRPYCFDTTDSDIDINIMYEYMYNIFGSRYLKALIKNKIGLNSKLLKAIFNPIKK